MEILEKIHEAYRTSARYPDLVLKLIEIGIRSYTVDVATGITMYRFADGETALNSNDAEPHKISAAFDNDKTISGIKDNQQAKTDYAGFMDDMAAAGVRFYEATLDGDKKRVNYIGTGGNYEEAIHV